MWKMDWASHGDCVLRGPSRHWQIDGIVTHLDPTIRPILTRSPQKWKNI